MLTSIFSLKPNTDIIVEKGDNGVLKYYLREENSDLLFSTTEYIGPNVVPTNNK